MAGAHIIDDLAAVREDLLNSLAGALTEAAGSRLHATTHRLDGPARALAGLLQRCARTPAGLDSSLTHSADQLGQNLRVVIDRRHHPVDDRRDMVQPNLELGDRFHAVEVKHDTPQRHVGAHVKLEQAENLGLQGDLGAEALHVQVDLLDLKSRDIEQHIGLRVRWRGVNCAGVVPRVLRAGVDPASSASASSCSASSSPPGAS